uniref:Copia protein n=1 Tax=Tanacetum cinerariifolium TaxID=118510 RepID=A0A6L2JTT8_TANCI|nr:copia protein [Tanacetum cinerariifolium]
MSVSLLRRSDLGGNVNVLGNFTTDIRSCGTSDQDVFSKRQCVRPPGFGIARASERLTIRRTPVRDVGQPVHTLYGHLTTTTTYVDNVGSLDVSSSAGHTSKAGVIDVGSNSVDEGSGTRSNTSTGEYFIHILLSSVSACRQIVVTDDGQVLEARKESSDEECSTSGRDDEEYAMAVRDFKRSGRCGDPNHLIGECLKPPKDKNQRAFVGGSWSVSSQEDDENDRDETCLMAQASSLVHFESSYFSDENSSIDEIILDSEHNSFINEEAYVAQPLGFIDFEKAYHVYKLKKALYGLKQAPKAWPDIMFSVCLCARFQEDPKTSHLETVKHIFRYIKGTMHLGLWYPKGNDIETVVYIDSDHERDYVDLNSISGICTFVGCCLTSWFWKKQTALAISTTEAEYVSAGKACQQALWMKQALIDYDIRLDDVPIMCGNKCAIGLSKNPVKHSRTKHIEIRHHLLRDNVQKGHISIVKVSSEDNITDILTKPLKRESFYYLRLGLGMMERIQ